MGLASKIKQNNVSSSVVPPPAFINQYPQPSAPPVPVPQNQLSYNYDHQSVQNQSSYNYGQQPAPQNQSSYNYGQQPIPQNQSSYNYGQQPIPQNQSSYNYGQQPIPHNQSSYNYGQQPAPQNQSSYNYGQQPIPQNQSSYNYGQQPIPQNQPSYNYGQQSTHESQIMKHLQKNINENGLHNFYPSHKINHIFQRAKSIDYNLLANKFNISREIVYDLCALALYDIVILVDDSGSMNMDDRRDDLEIIASRIAYVASLFDDDGIDIRFLNNRKEHNVKSEEQASQIIKNIPFSGMTPLGESLEQYVLRPFVINKIQSRTFEKPLLVYVLTDGEPTNKNKPREVILNMKNYLQQTNFGAHAVSYQFAQIGNDLKAQKYLHELDDDHEVGKLIDCTSSFEMEQDEWQKNTGTDLPVEIYLLKLMLGAIDSSYDEKDSSY